MQLGESTLKRCLVAMNQMKIGKASGPSSVVPEMLNAGGEKCLKSLLQDKFLEEWMLSLLV